MLCCGSLMAQPRIREDISTDGMIINLILENKDRPGTMTLFLYFDSVVNLSDPKKSWKFEIQYENQQFLSLQALNVLRSVNYRYRYRYIYGKVDSPVNEEFVYRMPCSTTKPVRVSETVNVLDLYGKAADEQKSVGFMFAMEKGDMVYAIRRGLVTKIDLPEKQQNTTAGVKFTSNSTKITVEQPDGTNAWYVCVDAENLFVKEGDEVFPSTPLALAGSYDGANYQVALSVYSQSSNPHEKEIRGENFLRFNELMPRFFTTSGVLVPKSGDVYTPICNDALVMCEMSKKERKMWLGSKDK